MSAPRMLVLLPILFLILTSSPLAGEPPILICGFTARLQAELASEIIRCKSGSTYLESSGSIHQLVYSPDGKFLAVTRHDKVLELLDGASGQLLRRLHDPDGPIVTVVFTPDGKYLASGGWQNRCVRLWDLGSGKAIRRFELEGERAYATDLAIAPDGKTLAISTEQAIHLWDLATGNKMRGLQADDVWTGSLAFAPDGKTLASYNWGRLRVWDLANLKEPGDSRLLHHQPVLMLCGTGRAQQREDVAFSRDGQRIYFGTGAHYQVQALAARSGNLVPLSGRGQEFEPSVSTTSFALSADGRTLALGGRDGVIRLVEVLTGQVRANLPGHQREVLPLAFSPDGKRLASAGVDQKLRIWDLTHVAPVPPGPLAGEFITAAWADLGGESERAYQAMQALSGEQGMHFLLTVLRPKVVPEVSVRRWIAELDSRDFPTRQAATEALEKLGRNVAPALRQAADGRPALEVRLRLEQILSLAEQTPSSPDDLREERIIELLERQGTPAARLLLLRLSTGSPQARLTELAKEALARRQ